MRCLKGLGEWQRLNLSCSNLLSLLNSVESSEHPSLSRLNSSASISTITGANTNRSGILPSRRISMITSPSGSNIENIVLINPVGPAATMPPPSLLRAGGSVSDTADSASSYLQQLNASQRAQLNEKISEIGAAACWGLGEWEQMSNYTQYIPEHSYEGSLYSCVLSLAATTKIRNSSDLGNIQKLIDKTRDLLDVDLTSMASQSYERSYQGT